jgi:hypothetical protein
MTIVRFTVRLNIYGVSVDMAENNKSFTRKIVDLFM